MIGGLLALDLATTFGWACALPGGEPEYGSLRLPSKDGEGAVFLAYERWLEAALTNWQPKLVVYEAPILIGNRTSLQTATRLIGLGVITLKCCTAREVYRVERANNSTVKKFNTGGGKSEKLAMIDAVGRHGWRPSDDNAADALGIFLYAEAKHAPHITRGAGPLFA